MRKAFDRVNHERRFDILIDNGLPGRLVKVVIDWYGKHSLLLDGIGVFLSIVMLEVVSAKVGYYLLYL